MLWYLLKTWAGKEEELVNEIRRTVPSKRYKDCFVIYQERIWRKQQRSIVHKEPLFPGYVFLTCLEKEPLSYNIKRKHVPSTTTCISCGSFSLFSMTKEDARFLEQISGDEHMVKLSYVLKNEEGNVCKVSEPLNLFQGKIERIQFKKRYAMVRHPLWGEEKKFVLGIVLKEDTEQNLVYLSRNKNYFFEQSNTEETI